MKDKNITLYRAVNLLTDNWIELGFDHYDVTILIFCFRQMNRYEGNTPKWNLLSGNFTPEFSMGHAQLPMTRKIAGVKIRHLVQNDYLELIKKGHRDKRKRTGATNSYYRFGRKLMELMSQKATPMLDDQEN